MKGDVEVLLLVMKAKFPVLWLRVLSFNIAFRVDSVSNQKLFIFIL